MPRWTLRHVHAVPGTAHVRILVKDPQSRRFQIVELTGPCRPDEHRQRDPAEEQRHGEQDEHHAHDLKSPRARTRKVRARYELMITVSELSGISTAATSGLSSPA